MNNVMERPPFIGIAMDENTSAGGNLYILEKRLTAALVSKGATPIPLTYEQTSYDLAMEICDGLMVMGGNTAFPAIYHVDGKATNEPTSSRFEHLQKLVPDFISTGKPVIGVCYGMQLIGCLYGSKLAPDLTSHFQDALVHYGEVRHEIEIQEGTLLSELTTKRKVTVNSNHKSSLYDVSSKFTVSAHSSDNVPEVIEMIGKPVFGLQFHPERENSDHVGQALLHRFVQIAAQQKLG